MGLWNKAKRVWFHYYSSPWSLTNNNQTKEETFLTVLSLMYVSAWELVCDLILLTLLNAEIQQAPRKQNI